MLATDSPSCCLKRDSRTWCMERTAWAAAWFKPCVPQFSHPEGWNTMKYPGTGNAVGELRFTEHQLKMCSPTTGTQHSGVELSSWWVNPSTFLCRVVPWTIWSCLWTKPCSRGANQTRNNCSLWVSNVGLQACPLAFHVNDLSWGAERRGGRKIAVQKWVAGGRSLAFFFG